LSWFDNFFETDEWLAVALARPPERTEAEVAFLAQHLPVGAHVLDVPCGTGRHSAGLSAHGYTMAGLDISERVIAVARDTVPDADFRTGDMRELPWEDASFDAVLNLWTAFGYFETQDEDERVLAEFARVLRPGGIVILDTVNQAAFVRQYRAKGWDDSIEGLLMLDEIEHDLITGRSSVRWTFIREDGSQVVRAFDHRVYTAAEYAAMFRRAGLEPQAWFGDFEGGDLTPDTWRMIVVAKRIV
jgi:ubiquinone/menaquinone biosynthesis C-methylase UbiE